MFYYSCRNSLVFLLPITAHIHNLQNVVVGAELQSTNVDLYIFLQEIFGQLTNLLWPSGTPHQSLAVWLRGKIKRVAPSYCKIFPISNTQNSTELKTYSNLINNFPDLWLKTHVQHSVCFIQNEVRASAEVCLSWFQKVNEPPWSGNADLHTLKRKSCVKTLKCSHWQYSRTIECYQTSFQVTDLGPFGSTTIDAGGLEARSSAIFLSHLLHLLRQLTSWCKHQTLATREILHLSTGLKTNWPNRAV